MKKTFIFFLLALASITAYPQVITLESPNGDIDVDIHVNEKISYSIKYKNEALLNPSNLSLSLPNQTKIGVNAKIAGKSLQSVKQIITSPFYIHSSINESYNELRLTLNDGNALVFRAYNNGVAFRWQLRSKKTQTIIDEEVEFMVPSDFYTVSPSGLSDVEQSFEENFIDSSFSKLPTNFFSYLPFIMRTTSGIHFFVAESDMVSYPGMFLKKENEGGLKGYFPKYPIDTMQGGYKNFNLRVTKRADYIAQVSANAQLPWRVIGIENSASGLLSNTLIYQLARPSKIQDLSWIKPGKVSWDWWNALNLEGVSFKTGINNETYKYYIDFAARNDLEYVILDEGWSETHDLKRLKDDINLQELVSYGKERNVGLILWAVWHVIDKQADEVLPIYAAMGIKGFKVDFIDRNDQVAHEFMERLAEKCATNKLLLDYHGAPNSGGLERTWPNIVNREGVRGAEFNKWTSTITPQHNIDLCYNRLLTGAMDYTPGSMHNVNVDWHKPVFIKPQTMGTRAHEVAKFVFYFAPLQMLADAPTSYEKEKETTDFIKQIPTVWDSSLGLGGELKQFAAIARKKDNTWYVAIMNNAKPLNYTLNFDFLDDGEYAATVLSDNVNSNVSPTDYKISKLSITKSTKMEVQLIPASGYTMIIRKK